MNIALIAALLLAIIISTSVHAYQNPLEVKDENGKITVIADPGIIRWMGKYYLYATKVVEDPGIRCWESADLVNWKFKSFCTGEDPAFGDRMAWNPAPFYYNGKFYLYVCSSDQNHRAFEADNPWGPFKCVNDDLIDVKSLDAMPFLDDDGRLYMFYAGWGGIQYRECSSPVKADGKNIQLATCKFSASPNNEWMEGPSVYKKDGNYYLQYCGNDWKADSYQVQTARAKSIPDLKPQKTNPLLMQLEGSWVATGCNHSVLGPDLKSLWTIYHCRKYGGGFRRLCLDRLSFDSTTGDLISTGPTWTSQDNPQAPTWSDDFRRKEIGSNWETIDGKWSISPEGFVTVDAANSSGYLLCRVSITENFFAEFNIRLYRNQSSARSDCGLVILDESRATYYLALDPVSRTLSLHETQNGKSYRIRKAAARMPASIDPYVWHTIRVQSQSGRVRIFMDDMKMIDTEFPAFTGKLGFIADNCRADFGWFGFSR